MILANKCYLKEICKKGIANECNEVTYNDFCVKLFKIDTMFESAMLPEYLRSNINLYASTEQENQLFKLLLDYKNNINTHVKQGDNLMLFSNNTGNGKTSWAVKILQNYIIKNWLKSVLSNPALFIHVPTYLRELKLNIDSSRKYVEQINNKILDSPLVVWDDIATKSISAYESEQLLAIIDSRLQSKKSNIYTCNISPEKLNTVLDSRLASRINQSIKYEFMGKDKRGIVK